jgi:hypothetical protein
VARGTGELGRSIREVAFSGWRAKASPQRGIHSVTPCICLNLPIVADPAKPFKGLKSPFSRVLRRSLRRSWVDGHLAVLYESRFAAGPSLRKLGDSGNERFVSFFGMDAIVPFRSAQQTNISTLRRL